MGIVNDRGRFYWVKRVPKRYASVVRGKDGQKVSQVRQALHTDSLREAKVKAAQVEVERLAEWEAILVGDGRSARKHFESARKLAQARGFTYSPAELLGDGDLLDVIKRILDLTQARPDATPMVAASMAAREANLGYVTQVYPTLPEVLDEYIELTKTRHIKKSDAQKHKWRLPRDRAVRNFITVNTPERDKSGDPISKPVDKITRADALAFRKWWSKRVEGGMKIESANKDFGHLNEILGTWIELNDLPLSNPFEKLRLDGKDERDRPAFSRDWIAGKILAPGALDNLNDEARDVLLITINTGLRPSEITDAPLSDFEVDAEIPFLRVAPHGRELKVAHTRRDIPLIGVALDAANRVHGRGGIQRYQHKAGAWSALVNKYLANNGLKESPGHTAYSIRHYVENALLAAKVDDRVRADILGHKYHRPSYGDGGALAGRKEALSLIAF